MKTKFSTRILAFVLIIALVVPTLVFSTSAEDTTITFELGANGTASHKDGSAATTYSATVDGYNLSITNGTKMYTGAIDAKGNSCIKFGTTSAAGSCQFTVPDDVTSVIIHIGKYKANTSKVSINGTTYTLSGASINGTYDAIEVDTTTNKTVEIATVSGGYRAMLNTIQYVIPAAGESTDPSVKISSDQSIIEIGKPLTLTANTTNFDGEVQWSSSDDTIASVSGGVVSGVKMGNATITATAGTASDTFDVTVYPASGKITIAEALEICNFVGNANSPIAYTVEGVVTAIDTVYSEDFDNVSVVIEDATGSILVFRTKGGKDILVGDTISVVGYLINYNDSKPEFAAGCEHKILASDADIEAIREQLNAVAAYMSLGYKYSAITTTETVTTVTDTLNRDVTGITGTSYGDWSGKTLDSGATYKGQSAGGNDSIQLRSSNSNSGIVTTASGGKVAKITVKWHSSTTSGRTLDIYGKNTAYTAATDLYGSNAGTKIGSIVCGTSTELVIEGDYEYIGLRSNSAAMYIESIAIEWTTTAADEGGTEVTTTTYSDSAFAIRCAVDAKLAAIANVTAYGIKVSAGDKEVCYTADASSWTVDGDLIYIVLNLGDIINDLTKLGTVFTVEAFVEYNGVELVSANEKPHSYSVADMVKEYYTNPNLQIAEVEHLYNYLVENKLIDENA